MDETAYHNYDPDWPIDSARAWVAAAGVALANGLGFGTAYTFGTFFDAMATEFGAGSGATALIFGVTLLFFFGFGVVAGPIFDRVGPRPMLLCGGTLFVGGLLLTARVDQLWLGVVTYGVGVGLGCGLYVSPLTALVGALFVRRRTMALALAAVGNGVGTLVLSPLAEWLIARGDWRSAYTTIALIAAVGLAVATVAVIDLPGRRAGATQADARSAARIARRAIGSPGFRSLFWSAALMSVGLYVAFAFVVPFAVDAGVSTAGASRLVGLIGLSSVLGRIGLMVVAAKVSPVRLMQLMLVVQPLAYLFWLVADGRYAMLVAFAVALGVAYGGFVAVSPEALIYLVGTTGIGTTMGIMFLAFGLGGLVGPPAAGWMADAAGSYTVPISVVIALLVAAIAVSGPMGKAVSRVGGGGGRL